MNDRDRLLGVDYVKRSKLELQSHPDFNETVYNMLYRLMAMQTEDLQKISVWFPYSVGGS